MSNNAMPPNDANSWANSPAVSNEAIFAEPVFAASSSEKAALWAAVLARLAVGYPLSPYAKMGRADLEADGALWADEMRDVPAGAIEELYRRTCARRALAKGAGFPPNIGDFRAAWLDPEWDFWAQQNAPPGPLALPAPLPDDSGPGARTAYAQNEHRRRFGSFVCCECVNAYGVAVTAVLRGDEWVCAAGACGMVVAAEVLVASGFAASGSLSRSPGEG